MSQVFISYSRRDTEVVDRIVKALVDAGVNAWIDREDIRAGNSWRLQIVEAIDTCDVFVLALSPNSAASDNVRKEIDLAQDSGRVIVPIVLDAVKIPAAIRYQLAGLQFVDVPMLGFDKALAHLVEVVQGEIAKKKITTKPDIKKIELVIQGVDLSAFDAEKQKQLLEFVAKLTTADQAQLKIASLTAGSVHAFVEMPAQTAYQLKTLALNRDKRFKQLGIASLRIAGDASFVNISLGIFTKTATTGLLKSLWIKMPFAFFFIPIIIGALIIFGVLNQTPRNVPPPLATSSPIPASTLTATLIPTDTPLISTITPQPILTATPTEVPVETVDRCPLFENKNITLTTLRWYPNTPLIFYFKITGGVPGLEDKTVDDGGAWNYSVNINGRITNKCEFVEGYEERLYCNIELPSEYSYTINPLMLSVNGCATPVYQNPIAEIPKIKVNTSGGGCSASPGASYSELSSWCACMGGRFSFAGSCIIP